MPDGSEGPDELEETSSEGGTLEPIDGGPNEGLPSVPLHDVKQLAHELSEAGPETTRQALFAAGMRFSGPLPPASELIRYNGLGNHLGTRLGEDYLAQREHERAMDRDQVKIAFRDADRADREQKSRTWALAATYVLLAAMLSGAYYLAKYGHPELAVALASSALLAV